jgi:hypothetical protein
MAVIQIHMRNNLHNIIPEPEERGFITSFIIIIIIVIADLQPFVGPWTLFQFLDPTQSR